MSEEPTITKHILSEKVDSIIKIIEDSDDDAAAHAEEDSLRLEVIREFCPDWVVAEIERLKETDFARWYS